jgi:hypothetical protein
MEGVNAALVKHWPVDSSTPSTQGSRIMPIIESEFLDLTRDLDLAAFWAENEQCLGFTTEKPRCAVSFSPDDHWIFEFMAVPSTIRYYKDKALPRRATPRGQPCDPGVCGAHLLQRGHIRAEPQTH